MKQLIYLVFVLFFTSCSHSSKELSPEEKKAQIYYGSGTNDLINKNYSLALKNLLLAYELSPKDTKILNNLGMAYYFKDQIPTSIKYLQASLKIDPHHSDARVNLGSLYFKMGKYHEAEKEYLKVSNDLVYSHQYRTYYNLGLIKLGQNSPQEAKDYFQKSLKNNEFYCPAHFSLGEMNYKEENFEEAYKEFLAASKGTCYEEPAPHYYQGLCLLQLKRENEAKLKFLDILHRFPKSEYYSLSKIKLDTVKNVESPSTIYTKDDKRDKIFDSTYLTPNF